MSVREQLDGLKQSVANVTGLVLAQSAQIAELKATIDAANAEKATAEADAAALKEQIDALNALVNPPAAQ